MLVFLDEETKMMNATLVVSRTSTKMSLKNPFANPYANPGLIAYVMVHVHSGNRRIVTSWGHLGPECEVGSTVALVGDQTGRRIGPHYIAAIMDLSTGVKHKAKAYDWREFRAKMDHYVVK
jgi:hypothetical protein